MITKAELRHAMLGGPAKTWHEWRVSMVAGAVTFLVLAVGLRLVTGHGPWLLWLAWFPLVVAVTAAGVTWGHRLVQRVLLGDRAADLALPRRHDGLRLLDRVDSENPL